MLVKELEVEVLGTFLVRSLWFCLALGEIQGGLTL